METPDILIVGGGIIGCTLARELARVCKRVVVVERGRVGSGASTAAAGLLTPAVSASEAGALIDLCLDSAWSYEKWVDELRQDGAGDVGFARPGLVDVWTDEALAEVKRAELSLPTQRPVQILSGPEVCQREPALTGPVAGAAFYPDDGVVDPVRLIDAVARVAERAGVTFRGMEPVIELVRDGDRVSAVHTVAARYRPGLVVLTAGAWSGALAQSLGLSLPTIPVKGQMLLADCRVAPIHGPVFAGDALFVPQADGRLALGVTVEHAGFDDRVTLDGVRRVLTSTCAMAPAVGGLPLVRAWAGLRPATPDGWPYMGPVPPLRNLWVSAGHFRKGILLAPVCARLMAQSILADHLAESLAPFKPTRRLAAPGT
jgi:glycine oxidase